MSRIGKKPIPLPQGVTATVDGQTVTAQGPKGELKFVVNDEVLVKTEDGQIAVEPRTDAKSARSKWGMSRTQIVNIVEGVKNGFEKKLEISGVGYRASLQGRNVAREHSWTAPAGAEQVSSGQQAEATSGAMAPGRHTSEDTPANEPDELPGGKDAKDAKDAEGDDK